MIKELIHDPLFLGIKAKPATKANTVTAKDLLDTLTAHKETCVGMAANMIGKAVCIIAFNDNGRYNLMYNPQIVGRSVPYSKYIQFISSSVSPISPLTQTDCTAISSGQYASL